MTDDKLIEEAAKAMYRITNQLSMSGARDLARAAFAVFEKAHAGQGMSWMDRAIYAEAMLAEKAHAPTDDEREALLEAVTDVAGLTRKQSRLVAEIVQAAGFRRTEVPEPQGEPTDAEVETSYAVAEPTDWGIVCADCEYCTEDPLTEADAREGAREHDVEHHPDSRAALRAASEVKAEGR